MGFSIGMPMLGLKQAATKGAKHAGTTRGIVEEMGAERKSATDALDRSRSAENVYWIDGEKVDAADASGEKIAAEMLAEAQAYSDAEKAAGRRKLRRDATIGVALIVKPETGWQSAVSPEKRAEYASEAEMTDAMLDDAANVLDEMGIMPKRRTRLRARHKDEANPHDHYARMAYDENGRLAGSHIVCLPTFRKLNRDFPAEMRKRGWPVDDLIAYDKEKMDALEAEARQLDADGKADEAAAKRQEVEAYKDECRGKRKKHGRDANKYAADKEREKAKAEAAQIVKEAETKAAEAEDLAERAGQVFERFKKNAIETEQGRLTAEAARDAAQADEKAAREAAERFAEQAAEAEAERAQAVAERDAAKTEKAEAEQGAEAARKAAAEAKAEQAQAIAERDAAQDAADDARADEAQAADDAAKMRRDAQADAQAVKAQAQADAKAVRAQAEADAKAVRAQAEADAKAVRAQAQAEREAAQAALDAAKEIPEPTSEAGYFRRMLADMAEKWGGSYRVVYDILREGWKEYQKRRQRALSKGEDLMREAEQQAAQNGREIGA